VRTTIDKLSNYGYAKLGFTPYDWQALSAAAVINGNDVLCVTRTGDGESVLFQLLTAYSNSTQGSPTLLQPITRSNPDPIPHPVPATHHCLFHLIGKAAEGRWRRELCFGKCSGIASQHPKKEVSDVKTVVNVGLIGTDNLLQRAAMMITGNVDTAVNVRLPWVPQLRELFLPHDVALAPSNQWLTGNCHPETTPTFRLKDTPEL
jgi:hypothetical protein